MNRWRAIVVVAISAAVIVMVASTLLFDLASTLLFDQPLLRRPWVAPEVLGPERWSRRLSLTQDASVQADLAALLASLISQFLVGVLILYVVPDRMRYMAGALSAGWRRGVRYLAIGTLMAIVLAVVGVLSILTIHTFPLPFILLAIFFLAAMCGMVALTFQLGRSLLFKAGWSGRSPLASLALGTLIIFAPGHLNL
jgi:MFS family permease